MKIRFQADADLNQNIVRALRRRAPLIDFQTAHEAGLHNIDDEAVLAQAAREGRILVSHDRRTMPGHFAAFTETRTSAGLILISQNLSITQAVEDLILIGEASEAEEWVNRLDSLPL
jgi:predicted nuclease of predicted toxin-antitoxin system